MKKIPVGAIAGIWERQPRHLPFITGALLQGGMVGLNALMGSELDFASLLGPASAKFTEQPLRLQAPVYAEQYPGQTLEISFPRCAGEIRIKIFRHRRRSGRKMEPGAWVQPGVCTGQISKRRKGKPKYERFPSSSLFLLFPQRARGRQACAGRKTQVYGRPVHRRGRVLRPAGRRRLLRRFIRPGAYGRAGFNDEELRPAQPHAAHRRAGLPAGCPRNPTGRSTLPHSST